MSKREKSMVEEYAEDPKNRIALLVAGAGVRLESLIWRLMEESGVTDRQLARRMGHPVAKVRKWLNDSGSMTIRQAGHALACLGKELNFRANLVKFGRTVYRD